MILYKKNSKLIYTAVKTRYFVVQLAVAGANRGTAAKMTNDILHGIYSMQYMATHCLSGSELSSKQPLPAHAVCRIVGT